nr:PEGA domain-containing protein [Polyangiaceae bacterium]
QKKSIRAELAALAQSGKLSVEESSGKTLDVLVDGAVVGTTPWTGVLSVGTHTVLLRGEGDLGTPPTAATVKQNQTTTLRLSAAVLDTSLRVEPTPANARIDIDGVPVGNGVWEGRLNSGTHKVEVMTEGFLAYSREVRLVSGQREVVRVALERDVSNPMWNSFQPHLYAELVGGIALTGSLGGGAATACASGECSDESHPLGILAGARVGYQLTTGLGLEIFLGYLRLKETVVRTKNANADVPTRATDYQDTTTLSGPLAALSASYTFLEQTPLTARVWAGAMRGRAEFENTGTFSGTVSDPSGATFDFSERVSIPEQSQNIWVPFVAPEIRFGYRFNKTFALDLGVAGFFFFPPSTPRVDTTNDGQADQTRSAALPTYPGVFPGNTPAKPGNMFLTPDDGFGAFVAVVPSVAARVDF